MDITSFRTPGLGDQTYLLTYEGKGVLVDPQRDIGRFLDAAAERDVELRFVLETHIHNDYVSGGEQAALRTGAELVLLSRRDARLPAHARLPPGGHRRRRQPDPPADPHARPHARAHQLPGARRRRAGGALLRRQPAGRLGGLGPTCSAPSAPAPWPACSTARCTAWPRCPPASGCTRPMARARSAPPAAQAG
ncbi:hypothetical protein ACFSTC_20170 [Nonomuraea ferruginea]